MVGRGSVDSFFMLWVLIWEELRANESSSFLPWEVNATEGDIILYWIVRRLALCFRADTVSYLPKYLEKLVWSKHFWTPLLQENDLLAIIYLVSLLSWLLMDFHKITALWWPLANQIDRCSDHICPVYVIQIKPKHDQSYSKTAGWGVS